MLSDFSKQPMQCFYYCEQSHKRQAIRRTLLAAALILRNFLLMCFVNVCLSFMQARCVCVVVVVVAAYSVYLFVAAASVVFVVILFSVFVQFLFVDVYVAHVKRRKHS